MPRSKADISASEMCMMRSVTTSWNGAETPMLPRALDHGRQAKIVAVPPPRSVSTVSVAPWNPGGHVRPGPP
jgi:hypothetical protein